MEDSSSHQDFAKKLLEGSQAQGADAEPAAARPRVERPPTRPLTTPFLQRNGAMSDSLGDLRKHRLLFLGVQIATVIVLTLIAVFASLLWIGFVLSGADWPEIAATGAAVILSAAGLIAFQFLLPRTQRSSVARLAQIELAYMSVEKSIEFWEDHFRFERQTQGAISAEDVARAVQSLTQNSERIIKMLELEAEEPRSPATGAGPEAARVAPSPAGRY